MSEFYMSLQLAWHVVVRNWMVYRKDFLANISPTLADPALMMTALGLGLSPFIGQIEGLSYAQYLAPGMVATTALFTAFFECSYGFYVRMTFESVFKAMLTTPIGVREVVIGEFLWVFIRAALMAAGVGLVLAVMGLLANIWSIFIFPFYRRPARCPMRSDWLARRGTCPEYQPVSIGLLVSHRTDLFSFRRVLSVDRSPDPRRLGASFAFLPWGALTPDDRMGARVVWGGRFSCDGDLSFHCRSGLMGLQKDPPKANDLGDGNSQFPRHSQQVEKPL